MSKPFTKYLALAMLVILMMNIGVWSVHSNWLAHELEHSTNLMPMAEVADHAALLDIDSDDDNEAKAPSAIDHQLLHAADHIKHFSSPDFNRIFLALPSAMRSYFTPVVVPIATLEAPFRPPCLTSSFI